MGRQAWLVFASFDPEEEEIRLPNPPDRESNTRYTFIVLYCGVPGPLGHDPTSDSTEKTLDMYEQKSLKYERYTGDLSLSLSPPSLSPRKSLEDPSYNAEDSTDLCTRSSLPVPVGR